MTSKLAMCAVLMVFACSESSPDEDGISVDVSADVIGASSWSGAHGQMELAEGFVTLASVELVACGEAAWRFPLISIAHAHSTSSPTTIGTPHALDVRSRESVVLGAFTPQPGSYCAVRLVLDVADEDAVGLESAHGTPGTTARLAGQHEGTMFNRSVRYRAKRDVSFSALGLSRDALTARVAVHVDPRKAAQLASSVVADDLVVEALLDGVTVDVTR